MAFGGRDPAIDISEDDDMSWLHGSEDGCIIYESIPELQLEVDDIDPPPLLPRRIPPPSDIRLHSPGLALPLDRQLPLPLSPPSTPPPSNIHRRSSGPPLPPRRRQQPPPSDIHRRSSESSLSPQRQQPPSPPPPPPSAIRRHSSGSPLPPQRQALSLAYTSTDIFRQPPGPPFQQQRRQPSSRSPPRLQRPQPADYTRLNDELTEFMFNVQYLQSHPDNFVSKLECTRGEMQTKAEAFLVNYMLDHSRVPNPNNHMKVLAILANCKSRYIAKRALECLLDEIFLCIGDESREGNVIEAEVILRASIVTMSGDEITKAKTQYMTTYGWLIALIQLRKDELDFEEGYFDELSEFGNTTLKCYERDHKEHNLFRYGLHLATEGIRRLVSFRKRIFSFKKGAEKKSTRDYITICQQLLNTEDTQDVAQLCQSIQHGSWINLHVCLVYLQELMKQDNDLAPLTVIQNVITSHRFGYEMSSKSVKIDWKFEILVYRILLSLLRHPSLTVSRQPMEGRSIEGDLITRWTRETGLTKSPFIQKFLEKLCQKCIFVRDDYVRSVLMGLSAINNVQLLLPVDCLEFLASLYKDQALFISPALTSKENNRRFGVDVYDVKFCGVKCSLNVYQHKENDLKQESRKGDLASFRAEIDVFKKLDGAQTPCPNIIHMIAASRNPPTHIITERLSQGSLLNYLCNSDGKAMSDKLKRMACDVCRAMVFLAEQEIVVRDLRASNVVVFDDSDGGVTCKLREFRSAEILKYVPSKTVTVPPNPQTWRTLPIRWMAVESLRNDQYSYYSDVWSFGVVLFEMFTLGCTPYLNVSREISLNGDQKVKKYVLEGNRLDLYVSIPEDIQALIRATWQEKPTDRPSIVQLQSKLDVIEFEEEYCVHPETNGVQYQTSNNRQPRQPETQYQPEIDVVYEPLETVNKSDSENETHEPPEHYYPIPELLDVRLEPVSTNRSDKQTDLESSAEVYTNLWQRDDPLPNQYASLELERESKTEQDQAEEEDTRQCQAEEDTEQCQAEEEDTEQHRAEEEDIEQCQAEEEDTEQHRAEKEDTKQHQAVQAEKEDTGQHQAVRTEKECTEQHQAEEENTEQDQALQAEKEDTQQHQAVQVEKEDTEQHQTFQAEEEDTEQDQAVQAEEDTEQHQIDAGEASTSEPRNVKWKQVSKTHRKTLGQLVAMMETNSSNCTKIGPYNVCFEERFCIGEGCDNTRVYVGLCTTGREVAVKRLPLHLYKVMGENEVHILMKQHVAKEKHVLNFLHCEVVDGYGYIILDLCEQTLKEYVASHTKEDLKKKGAQIIRQILLGLQTLHCGTEQTILHRDLKPSNVLVDTDNDFFLSDFGISRIIANAQQTHHSGSMGTNGWMATESIVSDDDDDDDDDDGECKIDVKYKRESDIQVAGMLVFYILTKGKHPYGGSWVKQCYNIKNGNAVNLDKLVESAPKDLIKWMLEKEPEKRPSVGDCLKHPFLRTRADQFDLITRVGNQAEIKANDTTSPVVKQLNRDPLVLQQWSTKPSWQSLIDPDVLSYITGKRPYSTDVADLLRFIRNTAEHWHDRNPPPTVASKVVEPRDYFLQLFPALPVHLHKIIRNVDPTWKTRDQLKPFFLQ